MYLSEALNQVGKAYVNGTVEFYNRMENNPWQAAHDRYEGQLVLNQGKPEYFKSMEVAANEFVKDCKNLIKLYEAMNPEQKRLSIPDCFVIGDEARVRMIQALEMNVCGICESSDSVKVTFHPTKGAGIYCRDHAQ